MNASQLLDQISQLSTEFGGADYVRGGGGNTSCKDGKHLYIKPSGVTLLEMTPDKFLGIDRAKLDTLYEARFPADATARESAVAAFVAGTVLPGYSGRPSVEAPLHNSFPQTFVVHTHPAVVNGMTCGKNGAEVCARLFPDALWVPFVEPGYTLSMKVREAMREYNGKHGRYPEMLFLANHGVFIAHDTVDGIRALYRTVMDALLAEVEKAGLSGGVSVAAAPSGARVAEAAAALEAVMGKDAAFHAADGRFPIPAGGCLTPDHIVYCCADMYDGDGSAASLRAFRDLHGYWPRVVGFSDMVLGAAASQRAANLALELARDAADTVRYAGAFGGVSFLGPHFVEFIKNWEVESYRQKVANK